MTIYLVRHAKAGERSEWDGDDRLRPLSKRGRRQAEGLVGLLDGERFGRIMSSPYVRCMESVVPLAASRGLAVEPTESLSEGASLESALALVKEHAEAGAIFCSHGDVIPMLLEHCAKGGIDLGLDPRVPKGSVWVLETHYDGSVYAARYLPPPPD